MRVEVAFLPDHLEVVSGRVAIVVDVLRATSTAIALFEAGAREIVLAGDLDEARRLKVQHGALLVGEEVGRTTAAPGCDLGPSPVGIAAHDFSSRRVVLSTTNGSVVLRRAQQAAMLGVHVGCLANLGAAAAAAVALARRHAGDVAIVCAARRGSRRFALDDAYCAGRLVERIVTEAETRGEKVAVEDGAAAALRIADGFATATEALTASATGRLLAEDGLAADIAWCARLDWSRIVPTVMPCGDELMLVANDDPARAC